LKFEATDAAKSSAARLRLIAGLLWLLGIGAQIFAISLLLKKPVVLWQIIVLIVIDLAFVITGSLLWKKSNRMDPPSEANKFRFFLQSQLGLITAIVAFLPLVIFILTNKNIDKKQKTILGGIAVVALLAAGITGYDFNPPSVEKYSQQINDQTKEVTELSGTDQVFWTPAGNKLHLYNDCYTIKNSDVSEGTVKQAWEARKIDNNEICKVCVKRMQKEKGIDATTPTDKLSSDSLSN